MNPKDKYVMCRLTLQTRTEYQALIECLTRFLMSKENIKGNKLNTHIIEIRRALEAHDGGKWI